MTRASRVARQRRETLVQQREEALGKMNAVCRRKFTQMERAREDARVSNLRYWHQLGKDLRDLAERPEHWGPDGYALVRQAAEESRRVLDKAEMFAAIYEDEEFGTLISLENPESNFRLHWGHVQLLLGLTTQRQREEFARLAVAQHLDPPALQAEIMRRRGGKAARPHGRTHQLPRTILGQLHQVRDMTRIWVLKHREVWNGEDISVLRNVRESPPESLTADHLNLLAEIGTHMVEAEQAAQRFRENLAAVSQHLQTVLATRERAAAAPERMDGRARRGIELEEGQAVSPAASLPVARRSRGQTLELVGQ